MVGQAKPAGWDQVYYLAELGSAAEIDTMLAQPAELLARTFTFEFDDGWDGWGIDVAATVRDKLHPKNIRALAASEKVPTVRGQKKLWEAGFDVVYSYGLANAVTARTEVNNERNVTPPVRF